MNKEFRVFDKLLGKYIEDCVIGLNGLICRNSPTKNGLWVVRHGTLEQWTGLLDKNGVKIFEGDILRHPSRETCYIGFSPCDCGLRAIYSISNGNIAMQVGENGQAVVVGNIHENPELLTEETK